MNTVISSASWPAAAPLAVLVQAGIAARAPILGELGIHDQHARRHEALRGDVGARELAQQLLLALGDLEPARHQGVERGEIALQAVDRRLDRAERSRRDRAALEVLEQLAETRDLGGDRLRDLEVPLARVRGQERRRRGHDPLRLARQLERGERRRHPLLGDAREQPADLGEGVHRGRRRDHRERADPEERQQQPPADAQALQERARVRQQTPLARSAAAKFDRLFRKDHHLSSPPYSLAKLGSSGTYVPSRQTYHTGL